MDSSDIEQATRRWVDRMVVGMDLCPFAGREVTAGRVRYAVTAAATQEQLLDALQAELQRLQHQPDVETTLLIHPGVLSDFYAYNQFLDLAEALLDELNLVGVYQIASFHPEYQFGGAPEDDAGNFSNRSPYPMLHLIREASLERVLESYPDIDQVPVRNIALMHSLGTPALRELLRRCHSGEPS